MNFLLEHTMMRGVRVLDFEVREITSSRVARSILSAFQSMSREVKKDNRDRFMLDLRNQFSHFIRHQVSKSTFWYGLHC
jgi:hypothetical protein